MRKNDALLMAGVGIALVVGLSSGTKAQAKGGMRDEAQALAKHIEEKQYDYARERVRAWQTKAGIGVDGHYGPETRQSLIDYGVANPPKILFVGAGQPTVAAARRAAAGSSTLSVAAPTVEANEAILAAVHAQKAAVKEPQTSALQATGNKVSAALRTLTTATQQKAAVKGPSAAPAGSKVNVSLARQTAPDVAAHIRNKGNKYTHSVVAQFQERAGMKGDGLYGPATASALRYYGANAPAPIYKGVNAKYVPPVTA